MRKKSPLRSFYGADKHSHVPNEGKEDDAHNSSHKNTFFFFILKRLGQDMGWQKI